jgi:hypothetical protein
MMQAMQSFPTFVVSRLGGEYEKAAFDYISGKVSDSGLSEAKVQVGSVLALQYKLDSPEICQMYGVQHCLHPLNCSDTGGSDCGVHG